MIKSFTDLRAWQYSHSFALSIYKATQKFPEKETWGLTSQIRRAAVSVPSNIAESYGRTGKKDKEHFFTIASGSLYELKSQLLLARDLDYLPEADFKILAEQANQTHKLLNGLLKSHRVNEKPMSNV